MGKLNAICVYCGSSPGGAPCFMEAARGMGAALARNRITLIYGGGKLGLMGAVADGALAAGGEVIGIIPHFLRTVEVDHPGVSELIVTPNMHVRKAEMFKRAEGFVILPGGLGTLEETFEMLTWAQLRQHAKPIVLVNLAGYWTPLLEMLDHAIERGFAHTEVRKLWRTVDRVEDALPALEAAMPEDVGKFPAEFDEAARGR